MVLLSDQMTLAFLSSENIEPGDFLIDRGECKLNTQIEGTVNDPSDM